MSLPIPGVRRVALRPHPDPRGQFMELWRQEWFPREPAFIQANLSISELGVLRGLHLHAHQADFQVVLSGRLFACLLDLRPGGNPQPWCFELAPEEGLLVPPGVAHGYQAIERAQVFYLVTATWDGSDEFGLAWDDPTLAIPWPIRPPILSARDQNNPHLSALRLPLLPASSERS
jgi:dTDP-4-dehydrorhamnose 3,5-epimerase